MSLNTGAENSLIIMFLLPTVKINTNPTLNYAYIIEDLKATAKSFAEIVPVLQVSSVASERIRNESL